MQYLRMLIESRPMLDRVPDQSLIVNARGDNDRTQATRGKDYAFVYSSQGKAIDLKLSALSGKEFQATWYDPRTGLCQDAGKFTGHTKQFIPPSTGYGQDWVLIVDDVSKNYKQPSFTN